MAKVVCANVMRNLSLNWLLAKVYSEWQKFIYFRQSSMCRRNQTPVANLNIGRSLSRFDKVYLE